MPQVLKKKQNFYFDDKPNDLLAQAQAVIKVILSLVCALQKQKSHLTQVAFQIRL